MHRQLFGRGYSFFKNGISGTRFNPTYAELNFKSHVSAAAVQDFDGIDRKIKRFYGGLCNVIPT